MKKTKVVEVRRKLELTKTIVRRLPPKQLESVQGGYEAGITGTLVCCDYTM